MEKYSLGRGNEGMRVLAFPGLGSIVLHLSTQKLGETPTELYYIVQQRVKLSVGENTTQQTVARRKESESVPEVEDKPCPAHNHCEHKKTHPTPSSPISARTFPTHRGHGTHGAAVRTS